MGSRIGANEAAKFRPSFILGQAVMRLSIELQ
jgi:hypothetical protein